MLSLSTNIISDDEINFLFTFFVINTQVSKIRRAFANSLTADIKFLKTQLSKMILSEKYLLILDSLSTFAPMLSSVESAVKSIENVAKGTFITEMQNLLQLEKLAKAIENKLSLESIAKAVKMLKNTALSARLNTLHKQLITTGITLTNNEIKDIIKAITSFSNRQTLSK